MAFHFVAYLAGVGACYLIDRAIDQKYTHGWNWLMPLVVNVVDRAGVVMIGLAIGAVALVLLWSLYKWWGRKS